MFKLQMTVYFQIIGVFIIFCFIFSSCIPVKNIEKPIVCVTNEGRIFTTNDSLKIYIFDYIPINNYESTIYIISGITGINHFQDKSIIDLFSNGENRVVVVHPRGTGYSDGKRGDIQDFSLFIDDYIQIIKADQDYNSKNHSIILYGHSMSSAIAVSVAAQLDLIDGVILINPPVILKKAKGMSPKWPQYLQYMSYMIFAKHTPIVNMSGDSRWIDNEEDKKESEIRSNDSLLVKYFSMNMMLASKKCMDSIIPLAKTVDIPLLLIYGLKDPLVDQKGCDLLFESWQCDKKEYTIIENGSHGKSTVILGRKLINDWIDQIN
jgi:pimeloyl-ACP methyl ester carboxylesterase